uniref:Tyrosine-protein kinase n=1 Tax=Panagrellus redivivus TaxID=6233 RepID=A0A7E4URD2_PANRE
MFSRKKIKRSNRSSDGVGNGKDVFGTVSENRTKGGQKSGEIQTKGRGKKKKRTMESVEQTEDNHGLETREEMSKDVKESDPIYTQMVTVAEKTLATAPWYHGLMPRDDIEGLLTKDGDFLVRKTEVGAVTHFALSIYAKQKCHHFLAKTTAEGKWYVGTNPAEHEMLGDMLDSYIKNQTPFHGTYMKTPISRPEWYVLHDNVKLIKKLGEGNFGEVHLGELLIQNSKMVPVAVKTLKGKLGKKERSNFVKEATMMRKFKHPNIVRILGVASQKEPIMIILELASGGCLKSHMKDSPEKDMPNEKLTRYTLEGAQGMEYLSDNGLIHRDIAARNCLLSSTDNVKIADFGLSVANANKGQITETKLSKMPVKWLAPETLTKGVFNQKTDVWSFGIMMWEIYSRGKKEPYANMSNTDARKAIVNELRLQPPDGTPPEIGELMTSCWKSNPDDRPTFKMLVQKLGGKPATCSPVLDEKDNFIPEEYFNLPA